MKLTSIGIDNFQSLEKLDIALPKRLAIVAGLNHKGKSSLAEAVDFALRGAPVRVSLQKHYVQLVTDGAQLGAIEVHFESGGEEASAGVTLPAGARFGEEHIPSSPALPYLMDPERFAKADADIRRTLLFALTGIAAKSDEIERRMLARGCAQDLITQMKPILRSGFGAAATFAKKQATEAKAVWRGITGETYGSVKSATWAAPKPEFDEAEIERQAATVTALQDEISTLTKSLGALEQQAKAYSAYMQEADRRKSLIEHLPSLKAKLAHDDAELATWEEKVAQLRQRAGTGPREGLIHDLARALHDVLDTLVEDDPYYADARAALAAYEKQYGALDGQSDLQAAADLPRAIQARDLMARSVENDRRDIATAEAAATLEAQSAPDAVQQGDLEAVRGQLAERRTALQDAQASLQEAQTARTLCMEADTRTATAQASHEEVVGWSALGDALAPDGIPGDLLAEALAPMNARMLLSSERNGWPQVQVDRDMEITAGGRLYGLLSKSEQWQANAAIGEALAQLSGLRLLILDGFDILDLGGRADLLGWMDELAAENEIDTVLLLGTLKQPPPPPSEAFTVHWIGHTPDAPATVLRQAA